MNILGAINAGEIIAFVLYFLLVIGIGIYFFLRGKSDSGEKGFFIVIEVSGKCLLNALSLHYLTFIK